MKKVELLAPAGSWEALNAAIAAGADAVYIGGSRFGARAYANNLDEESMLRAIDFVHMHGKKLYLTVNTLLKEAELEDELYDYLAPYYERGLDGVIVQDMGVVRFISQHFPKLPIHASTQMTITGELGAEFLEQQGIVRVVPARELSLEEIRAIHENTGLEIETFVHGALCYCYSGQCLFSSMLGGRSGNRGRCAQPCRLPYQVRKGKKRLNDEQTSYPLSSKDMCTLTLLPEIIGAGVTSLKIEGRMKKPEYTAGVVRIYRKYLDLHEQNPKEYSVTAEDLRELAEIYNRDGFNRGYYKVHNGREMMAIQNKKSIQRNDDLFNFLQEHYVGMKIKEKINGILKLKAQEPAILEISCGKHRIFAEGFVPEPAKNQPTAKDRIEQQMRKTGNTAFEFENLQIEMTDGLFVPMQSLNELRRNGLAALEEKILSEYRREAAEPFSFEDSKKDCPPVSPGNSPEIFALCEKEEQLDAVLKNPDIEGIYCSISMIDRNHFDKSAEAMIKRVLDSKKSFRLALPHMVRSKELHAYKEFFRTAVQKGVSAFLVRNLESFAFLRQLGLEGYVILAGSLYTWNHRSRDFWQKTGILGDTVPSELNFGELKQRDNSQSELVIYGYQPLMVSVQCVQKNFAGCSGQSEYLTLRDRYGAVFGVQCYCDFCYNVIYNSVPLGLLKEREAVQKLGCQSLRLSFSTENGEETEKIVKTFMQVYRRKAENVSTFEFTKGHFRRGVE